MMNKPRIRILSQGDPDRYWCGWWPGGYSILGRVSEMSLQEAVRFYFRVLALEALDRL
jgi:hypothetical protein